MSPSTEVRENREFAREIKFLISPAIADQVRDWARGRLAPDPNAAGAARDAYQITSLYFDTAEFDVFHRRGSFGRSKYRIRRYGRNDVVFLERKLKTRGLLTKRRSIVKIDELDHLAGTEPDSGWSGRWFQRRLAARQLRPVCQISYERTARVAMTGHGPIRLTLDEGVRAVPIDTIAFQGGDNCVSILENHVMLELKFLFDVPLLFKLLVEEFALNATSVSKYRLAASALKMVTNPTPASDIPFSLMPGESGPLIESRVCDFANR